MKKKTLSLQFEIDLDKLPESSQLYEDEVKLLLSAANEVFYDSSKIKKRVSEGTTENGTTFLIKQETTP